MWNRHKRVHSLGKKLSAGLPLSVEQLEFRMLLATAAPLDAKNLQAITKLGGSLWRLYESTRGGATPATASVADDFQIDDRQRVAVTLNASDVKKASAALAALGFAPTASSPSLHFAEGMLPIASLGHVAKAGDGVGRFMLRRTPAPISLAGSVNSEADFVLEANRVRATLPPGFDGSGQLVGVLSDSFNYLGGAAADMASGDLPASVSPDLDYNFGGTDEGRAMLQVIHDLVPGASLAFATTVGGEDNFATNITRLANVGANVIVDDQVYAGEPMFQEGTVAKAIDAAVTTHGVSYFSATGNFAGQSFESNTIQFATYILPGSAEAETKTDFYDFNPGAAVDTTQRITLSPGGKLDLGLQWDDPFYTESGVDTDLDVFLVNPATGEIASSSEDTNILDQAPVEELTYQNPSSTTPLPLDLLIRKYEGPDPGRIKYVNYGDPITIDEYVTNSPAVVPHAAALYGQGVGAVAYFDQNHPEAFTSPGPSTILFSPEGLPITPEVRQLPQIASIDGVNNTFLGHDTDADGKPNFFGTSAAAAHAAAVAALVRQANPSFTPPQVYSRLQTTARDIGAAGFDNVTGYGLINAYRAVYPTVTPAILNFSNGFESGALSSAYETHATGSGRILVTGDHGPFAGSKHLTLDSSIQSGGGLNEVTLHVNAGGADHKILSFREREFDDEDNAMLASFVGSSNSDGVALSVDGTNWFRVVSLTGANSTNTYALKTFDLSAIAAANGITLGADTRIRVQQYGAFPIASDGIAFDELSVVSLPVTTAPGGPDLMPDTDSGISNSDNLTNRDNSNLSTVLNFNVSGTVAGATVTVYADGVSIGSAVAGGTSTIVTTSGSSDLTDGVHQFTARQTESGKTESADSSALAVTIDTVSPSIVRNGATPAFLFDTAPHHLMFNFSENVEDMLEIHDLTVQRAGSGSAPPQATALTYNSASNSAIFALTGTVPDGNFSANLNPTGATDAAGNELNGDTSFDFLFLTADANHDARVNSLDFAALAQHFNEPSTTFSHGNFNYDGQTNSMDFNALATLFGAALNTSQSASIVYPPSQRAAPTLASLFSDRAIAPRDDDFLATVFDSLPTITY
jgi:hypothetical protein